MCSSVIQGRTLDLKRVEYTILYLLNAIDFDATNIEEEETSMKMTSQDEGCQIH